MFCWRLPVVISKLACSMYSQSGDVLLRMPRPELDPRFAIPQHFRLQLFDLTFKSPLLQRISPRCAIHLANRVRSRSERLQRTAFFPIARWSESSISHSRFLNPDTSLRSTSGARSHSHDVGSAILVGASALPALGISREACDFLFYCCRLFRPRRAGHPASYPTVFRIRRPRANSLDISE